MAFKKTNVHVLPNSDCGWVVKRENAERSSGNFDLKQDAIDYGRTISRKSKTELFVHNRDGKIAWRDSHGNDPFPPRG